MRIAQIVLPTASQYERKSQRADYAALREEHEVIVLSLEEIAASGAEVAHVYACGDLPAPPFVGFPVPYVSAASMGRSRWRWRKPSEPRSILSPLATPPLPEAVEDAYFEAAERHPRKAADDVKIVGSFDRPSVRNAVGQTLARIERFRSDVKWQTYDHPPTPEDLAGVDLWVDPAVEESDFDGFVAEAFVVGLPIVATRTPIGVLRLEQGRTGLLVPPRDPNEMTHAILAALFKPEVAENKRIAARQTVSKYRARRRQRVLTQLYEALQKTTRP
jgi:hypothetical protein